MLIVAAAEGKVSTRGVEVSGPDRNDNKKFHSSKLDKCWRPTVVCYSTAASDKPRGSPFDCAGNVGGNDARMRAYIQHRVERNVESGRIPGHGRATAPAPGG